MTVDLDGNIVSPQARVHLCATSPFTEFTDFRVGIASRYATFDRDTGWEPFAA